jgi:hypothetical protein
VISILLISPPKVIYVELICVKDTPHFFPNLFQNHPVYDVIFIFKYPKTHDNFLSVCLLQVYTYAESIVYLLYLFEKHFLVPIFAEGYLQNT